MYGILPRIIDSSDTEEEKKNRLVAYAWLNGVDSNGEYTRQKELDNYIATYIIRDSDISVEDVRDALMDRLLECDYDDDKAMNYNVCVKKSVKSYVYDNARWAYLKLISQRSNRKTKRKYKFISLSDEVSRHDGKDNKEGDVNTIGDMIADEKAEQYFDDLICVSVEEAVDKLIRVTNTVYDGFVALYIVKSLCGDCANESKKKQVMTLLGLKPITRSEMSSEEIIDVIQDLSKFEDDEVVETIMQKMPSARQLVDLIKAVNSSYQAL